MGDLILKGDPGILVLNGSLKLVGADGGKVLAGSITVFEVLVENSDKNHSTTAPPVLLPPQAPVDDGQSVSIIKSFNSSVKANGKPIVTMGTTAQGNSKTWPGMVLPSSNNSTVQINYIPINVVGDMSITLPNGGSTTLDPSGQ
jgi:uncharacterized Zn-binding protein involved in type VI secretion